MSAVVIRVKRKNDEEPVDILDVVAKKSKLEADPETESRSKEPDNDIKVSLRFAGTLPNQDCSVVEPIKQAMRKEKLEKEYKQHVPESIIEQSRKMRKLASEKSRFSLISSLRDSVEEINKAEPGSVDVVRLIDLEQSTSFKSPIDILKTAGIKEVEETVTCNGTPMVREHVKADHSEGAAADVEPDYVYDVYFARDQERHFRDIEELLKVEAFQEDYMFSEYRDDSDDVYEDDDDSNDEDNWRNDYPEEPEYAKYSDLIKEDAEGIQTFEDLWDDMANKVNLEIDEDESIPQLNTYASYKKRVMAEIESLTDDESLSADESDQHFPPDDS